VIDSQPRQWTTDELETLRQLAMSAGRELSLRSALAAATKDAQHSRALVRSREEVVAVVGHDLRTPLQILELSVTLLRRAAPASQQPVFERVSKAISSMKSLADTLLSSTDLLAPMAAGRAPVVAGALMRDAVDMMTPIAQRAGIDLVEGDAQDATITVDYSLMLRALGNLIGNAIKYSKPGGTVLVSASREGQRLKLAVSDHGIGMTQDEQERAFDSGWQGAAGMVRGDGAGLGLAIVRR
jgi:signal transduction histidine kinase